jgi:hypothetical protein
MKSTILSKTRMPGSKPSKNLSIPKTNGVFQPRSSIPHITPPPVALTRLTLNSQNTPTSQGLTGKLSQLWACTNNSTRPTRRYVGKESQLNKLRLRMKHSERFSGLGMKCGRCRDGVIRI